MLQWTDESLVRIAIYNLYLSFSRKDKDEIFYDNQYAPIDHDNPIYNR